MQQSIHPVSRIIFFCVLFWSAFFLPGWVTFLGGLVVVMAVRSYYEFFVIVLLLDFLYATSPGLVVDISLKYTLIGIVVFAIVSFLKQRLFVYQK